MGDPLDQWGRGGPQCWMLIWRCDLHSRDVAWFVTLFGDVGGLSLYFGIGIGLGISGKLVSSMVFVIIGCVVFGTWSLTMMEVHGDMGLDRVDDAV